MKKVLLIALIFICSSAVHAQQPSSKAPFKIAALNLDALLQIMPEYKTAMDSAQAYYNTLQAKMTDMQKSLDSMIKEAGEQPSELNKRNIDKKEQEVKDYQTNAQEDFTNYRAKLLEPVYEKIQEASQKVAAREGYAFVLDSSQSSMVVLFAANAYSIFDDVCDELGIPKSRR